MKNGLVGNGSMYIQIGVKTKVYNWGVLRVKANLSRDTCKTMFWTFFKMRPRFSTGAG